MTLRALVLTTTALLMAGCLSARPPAGSGGGVAADVGPAEEVGESDAGQTDAGEDAGPEVTPDTAGEPDVPVEPVEPEGLADGEPCTEDDECAGGRCITEEEYGFPDGYCTTVGCEDRTDCQGEGNACYIGADPPFCVRLCSGPGQCREG